MDAVIARIRGQVSSLVETDVFRDRLRNERLEVGDCIVINNSFLYRDKPTIKTNKSDKYLALPVIDGGVLDLNDMQVIIRPSDSKQIKDLVVVKKKDLAVSSHVSLRDAVLGEMGGLGRMVFLLIGEIGETPALSVPCVCGSLRAVVLEPTLLDELAIDGDQVRIRNVVDPEALWFKLETLVNGDLSANFPVKDKKPFMKALAVLAEEQHATLRLPAGSVSDDTLLDRIGQSLGRQADDYEDSLKAYLNDPGRQAEFNNVLRIAYNFDSEAGAIITLLISLSDLKPLLSWCTVFDHWRLYRAFEALPWGALSLKPALKDYSESIRAARNSRFHHLLPINTRLEADLEGVLLKAKKITLFGRFSPRGQTGNALYFEDKEIIELLLQFTHVEERDVADEFWVRNLEVLRRTADLVSSTCAATKMLLPKAAGGAGGLPTDRG